MTLTPFVNAGGLTYLSATVAEDASGRIAGDVSAQTRSVIERSRAILSSAGTSLDRVVAVMVYLNAARDFPAMNDAYRAFWPNEPPTRTTVVTNVPSPNALVAMSMIAVPPGAERTVIRPEGWMASPNPYSYAIRTGDTLFLSGLVARNGRDNTVVSGDVATQTRAIMDNAAELLNAAGMTHGEVVSARVFLPDVATFQDMNAAYRRYFPAAPPARATVQANLAGNEYSVEITLVASSAPRQAINSGPVNPNLSGAIRSGDKLYVSGVLGNTPENTGDASTQTREMLARVRQTLDAASYTPADIVDGVVYLTDLAFVNEMNESYGEFFEGSRHASAILRAGLVVPGAVVEAMFTAVRR